MKDEDKDRGVTSPSIEREDTTSSSTDQIWMKSAKELVDKSAEEEFDDYFKDMLL